MMSMLRDWLWIFAIFPLWAVSTIVVLVLIIWLEKITKIHLPEAFYAWSAFGGLMLATALLLWADCAFFIDLPFAEPVCRTFGL